MKIHRHVFLSWTLSAALLLSGCSGLSNSKDEEPDTASSSGPTTGEVSFSSAGGLFEESFSLALSTDISGGLIRYTTDGSDPTAASALYEQEIPIEDRTDEENLLSAIVTGGGGGFGGGGGGFGGGMGGYMGGGRGPRGDRENAEGFPGGEDGERPDRPERAELPEDANGQEPPERPSGDGDPPSDPPSDLPDGGGVMGGPGGPGGSASAPAENVFKGTVIKAAVFSESGERMSDIFVQSYFVSEDIFTRYGDLPIVSIVTDADNFFDSESGIYTNYNQSGADWERPVHFELFESDGSAAISQNMGVRINGGTTRSLAQKALRFYAKTDYDEENPTIEYALFEGLTQSSSDEPLTTFKRIILRSSGNDNSGSLFRDALMQTLASGLNVDTQAARPCVAFLNGEFWGIYNLRERYDDHYFANHYNIDRENVAVLEISNGSSTPELSEGDESDLAYYNEMIQFFQTSDLTDEASYQKAQEYIDVDNIIDYFIANIYSGNTDWPANNNVFWRYKTANGGFDASADGATDGRFRWVLKDMDWGFGLRGSASENTLLHALNENASGSGRGGGFTSEQSTLIFRKLLENERFQAAFINRFCDVMNTSYDPDTVVELIGEMKAAIAPAIAEQSNRYPSSVSSVASWESNIEGMISFAQQRPAAVLASLQERFSLGAPVSLTLTTDPDAGRIRVNTTNASDASSWSGSYFAGTSQTLTALPEDGRVFIKFIVTDNASGETTESGDSVLQVTLGASGTTVEAVFE